MKLKMDEYLGLKEPTYVLNWKKKWCKLNNSFFYFFLLLFFIINCSDNNNNPSRVNTLPYYREATFTPHWLEPASAALDTFHRVPSFELINQNGQLITEKSFDNKIYVTDFFFTTCPGICPKMTASMGVLQDALLDMNDVLLLSHSVMPAYDSVSVLKNYASAKGVIDDKWHLVTGDRDHIYSLGRNAYFVEEDLGIDKDPDDFLHTENFVLIDKNKHIRGIYNGLNKTAINQLLKDIITLRKEST